MAKDIDLSFIVCPDNELNEMTTLLQKETLGDFLNDGYKETYTDQEIDDELLDMLAAENIDDEELPEIDEIDIDYDKLSECSLDDLLDSSVYDAIEDDATEPCSPKLTDNEMKELMEKIFSEDIENMLKYQNLENKTCIHRPIYDCNIPQTSTNKRQRKKPPSYPRKDINIYNPQPAPVISNMPETYTKHSKGPCCLCGNVEPGKNGWRLGFCGPKSFCSACYQANTINRRALFYKYDSHGRLVIINQSQSWQQKGFPPVVFANKQISECVRTAPASRAKRFRNWIS